MENFHGLLTGAAKRWNASKFCRETFANSYKISKFAKSFLHQKFSCCAVYVVFICMSFTVQVSLLLYGTKVVLHEEPSSHNVDGFSNHEVLWREPLLHLTL